MAGALSNLSVDDEIEQLIATQVGQVLVSQVSERVAAVSVADEVQRGSLLSPLTTLFAAACDPLSAEHIIRRPHE